MNTCKMVAMNMDLFLEKRGAFSVGAIDSMADMAMKTKPALGGGFISKGRAIRSIGKKILSKNKDITETGKSFSINRVGAGVAIGSVPVLGGAAVMMGN